MTCAECKEVAAHNRAIFDAGSSGPFREHPENCECTCQHMPTVEWDEYYSCPRPVKELL